MLLRSAIRSNSNSATILFRDVTSSIHHRVAGRPTGMPRVSINNRKFILSTSINETAHHPMMSNVMNHHSSLSTLSSYRDATTSTTGGIVINEPIFSPTHNDVIDAAMTTANTAAMMTYHTSASTKQADVAIELPPPSATTTTTTTSNDSSLSSSSSSITTATTPWINRWIVTVEAAVSKIFPGGFGWQTGSLIATSHYFQYTADSMNFALCTGIGDAIGVFGGHCLYYSIKRSLLLQSSNDSIDMTKDIHTGLWLGCAAFCSGTVWQPIVTTLQLSGCTFTQVMIGTWVTCSTAFYIGLRAGRTLLPLSTVSKPTYENSQTDVALSISIGGATGFFVGTDTVYVPEQNFLSPLVGITDTTSDVMGCTLAGTSTAMGFVTSQSVLNTIYPKQKSWND